MRKATMLGVLMALLVGLFAAVAYADVLNGTSHNDTLRDPTAGNDEIYGKAGSDNLYADFLQTAPDNDADLLKGQRGHDVVDGRDGDVEDTVTGNPGHDYCYVDQIGTRTDTVGRGCEVVIETPV
jgi:Ca2+-binding RTX toxin-like protein